jgi:hypothetical protein
MGSENFGEIERVVAVDWSGDRSVAGQRRKIWAGVWTGGVVTLEAGRTRAELVEWLVALGRETPAMVVGMDCCFSYPAWFVRQQGCKTVFDFWQLVANGAGERWLGVGCEENERDVRFWGRPHRRPEEFSGDGYRRMMRGTDWENKVAQGLDGGDPERAAKMRGIQAKSPFQIGGAGAVGTGSVRAMEWLRHLHGAGFRVWPFEGFEAGRPLLVEMYTRLLTGAVAKSNAAARKQYLAAKRATEPGLYGGLGDDVLAKALGSEDAFDALVCCLEMVRHRGEFAGLRVVEDEEARLEGVTWRPRVMG